MVGDGKAPLRLPNAADPAGPAPTPPPPEDRRALIFAAVLFLGSLGAVLFGLVITLVRQIRKKRRRKGSIGPRKDR